MNFQEAWSRLAHRQDTMTAVVYRGRKDIRIEERPRPRLEDDADVVVRVTLAGLCGSDLHLYHYSVPGLGGVVLGHEMVGVVEEAGPAVTRVRPGDRVAIAGMVADGTCWACQARLFSQCTTTNPNPLQVKLQGSPHAGLFGFGAPTGGYSGGQAGYVRVPFADVNCLPLPDDVSDEQGVFLSDVLNVAWMANDLAATGPGTSVAVWGCGPVGLLALECARARGVTRMFAIDEVPHRLEMARRRFGATAIDFSRDDVVARLHEATEGRGPDVGIEAAGFRYAKSLHHKAQRMLGLETDAIDTLSEMVRAVRPQGTLVLAGFYLGFANQFPIGALMQKNLVLRGSAVHVQAYWEDLLERMRRGELDPTFTVTHRLPLERAPDAYRLFDEKEDGVVKVLFHP